jgi:hypothetical protein
MLVDFFEEYGKNSLEDLQNAAKIQLKPPTPPPIKAKEVQKPTVAQPKATKKQQIQQLKQEQQRLKHSQQQLTQQQQQNQLKNQLKNQQQQQQQHLQHLRSPFMDVKKETENLSYIHFKHNIQRKKQQSGKPAGQVLKDTTLMISALINSNLTASSLSTLYKASRLLPEKTRNRAFREDIREKVAEMWQIYAPGADMECLLTTILQEGDWLLAQELIKKTEDGQRIMSMLAADGQSSNTEKSSKNLVQVSINPQIMRTTKKPQASEEEALDEEPNLSAILTQIMNESAEEDDVICLDYDDAPGPSTSKKQAKPAPPPPKQYVEKGLAAKVQPSAIKECCKLIETDWAKLGMTEKMDFKSHYSSLSLIARYVRERVLSANQIATWSEDEVTAFCDYVISVLAISGQNHYGLKNLFDQDSNNKKRTFKTDLCIKASKYICKEFCHHEITDVVWTYFSSGFFKVRHSLWPINPTVYRSIYK